MSTQFCDTCGKPVAGPGAYCDHSGTAYAQAAPPPPPVPPQGAQQAHYAPPPAGQAPPMAYAPAPAGTNGLAVASLVLGILWLYWLGSILAVIFGHVALSQINQRQQAGRGLAIAGLVLGWVGVGILVTIMLIGGIFASSV